jgi:Bacterial pre-peptidase C-terminal domain/Metallo-peptidase family M12
MPIGEERGDMSMPILIWAPPGVSERATKARARRRKHHPAGLIAAIERLEPRCLLSATGVGCDHEVDLFGNEYHALDEPDPALDSDTTGDFDGTGTLQPLSETFFLHSDPGASKTIYLDFDGHVTSGTTWNSAFTGGASITTPAFDFAGGASVFTDAELTRIQYIWQRVVEDFLPFDVDVTTEDPGAAALSKNGGGDKAWGIRVAIGGNSSDWYGAGAGGVAYVGSFTWSSDAPVFVFTENLANGEKYIAEAISHEVGHSLGLSHDGTSSTSYYQGQGSGATGWAPIMGVGYYKELTQWSRGEYAGANNTQDDLAIITSSNGFGYRLDDYGNTAATAGSLDVSGTSATGSGIIETALDRDVFSFTAAAGTVSFSVTPANRGANLDVLAELYDSAGNLVASGNPTSLLSASLSANVAAGTYYLHVSGVGKGSPTSDGYSDYDSLGAYRISGTLVAGQAVDISGDYLFNGATTHVVQSANSLTFINEHGGSSAGEFLSSTQVVASGWGNLVGNIVGNNIVWANGSTWTKGTLPDISGDYLFNGVARILQSGDSLTFINEHGGSAAGVFLDATHVKVTGWGNLTGTISGNDVVWANGSTWVRAPAVNIAGDYTFNGATTSVQQSGASLTFTNEHGGRSDGYLLDATHVRATDWGNLVGTLNGGRIDWANGSSWAHASSASSAVPASSLDASRSEVVRGDSPLAVVPLELSRTLHIDTLRSGGPDVAPNAGAQIASSRSLESAPIDVDEVFAAFQSLQSSMDKMESAGIESVARADGPTSVVAELHGVDLLEFVLELVASPAES